MAGHVDLRVIALAPLERVWAVANDPVEWARAGHAVQELVDLGDRLRFRVTMPGDEGSSAWTYVVERVMDVERRTVYSRWLEIDHFTYTHLWFSYEPVEQGTEIRCVVDFEMAPESLVQDREMEAAMVLALGRNLAASARLAEASAGATSRSGPRST
jgi:hypothetical protein